MRDASGANRLRGTVEDINFLGSIVRLRVRLGEGHDGAPPAIVALDTFNEPHLTLPDVGASVTISFPPEACFVLGAAGDSTARERRGRRGGVTVNLDGIDLIIFDKDGTLIDFGSMWSGWALTLTASLERSTGRSLEDPCSRCSAMTPMPGS